MSMLKPPIPFAATMTGMFASMCWKPRGGIRYEAQLWEGGAKLEELEQGEPISLERYRWLVTNEAGEDVWRRSQAYTPAQTPNLHRDFAALERTPEAIAAFANDYGFLGRVYMFESDAGDWEDAIWGEPFIFWIHRIEEMQHLMWVHDIVSGLSDYTISPLEEEKLAPFVEWGKVNGDVDADIRPAEIMLRGDPLSLDVARGVAMLTDQQLLVDATYPVRGGGMYTRWDGGYDVTVSTKPSPEPPTDQYFPKTPDELEPAAWRIDPSLVARGFPGDPTPEISAQWEYGDPVGPMHYFVHRYVTTQLEGRVTPALLPLEKGSKLVLFTDTLLTAMYALFALEITGQTKHRPRVCPGCGQVFVPAHGRRRYHDERCKSAYHRRVRKEQKLRRVK